MYARSIPVATFSLALVINGSPEVSVVYDPFIENLYTSIKGQGAYKNGEKIKVNNIKLDDMESIVHYDMWPKINYNIYDAIKEIGNRTYLVSIGSIVRAGICVAEGNFNAAIFPLTTRKHCDTAAIKLLVEEAGGKVTDLFGREQRYDQDINGALISNGIIHDEILEIIKRNLE